MEMTRRRGDRQSAKRERAGTEVRTGTLVDHDFAVVDQRPRALRIARVLQHTDLAPGRAGPQHIREPHHAPIIQRHVLPALELPELLALGAKRSRLAAIQCARAVGLLEDVSDAGHAVLDGHGGDAEPRELLHAGHWRGGGVRDLDQPELVGSEGHARAQHLIERLTQPRRAHHGDRLGAALSERGQQPEDAEEVVACGRA